MLASIFDVISGFHQAAFLLGATLLLGIAAAILADFFHWRIVAREYWGEIVAVRASRATPSEGEDRPGRQRMFFPVIEYLAGNGERIRALTHSGSSRIVNRVPGRRVRILVKPEQPDVARVKGLAHPLLGVVIGAFGSLLLAIALTQYRTSVWTLPCIFAVVAFVGFKLFLPKKSEPGARTRVASAAEWKRRKLMEVLENCDEIDADEAHRIARDQNRSIRRGAPVLALMALGLLAAGYYTGQGVLALESAGTPAEGEVVRVEARQGQDSEGRLTTTYYPVVAYQTERGKRIEFTSSFGSNPASYQRGERVAVLYSPESPLGNVMIDRGVWNWALPVGLAGAGLIALWVSLSSYFAARRRHRQSDPRLPPPPSLEAQQLQRS